MIIQFGSKAAEKEFKSIVKEIVATRKGNELLYKLHKSPEKYYINSHPLVEDGKTYKHAAYKNNVYVTPDDHPLFYSNRGISSFSTLRILSHELGHLAGASDVDAVTRRYIMENVNTWENPIASEVEGGLERTRYEVPPQKYVGEGRYELEKLSSGGFGYSTGASGSSLFPSTHNVGMMQSVYSK